MNYQRDYSSHFPSVLDSTNRKRKAVKILRTLTGYLCRADLRGLVCLDLGCSSGIIAMTLAEAGACVFGIDIDAGAIEQAPRGFPNAPGLAVGDAGAAPLPANTFDVVVCTQVYEHAPSLELLIREIHRTLKPGGICFFSGPNCRAIIEDHYGLPFLSWLPRQFADHYVRLAGRGTEYYERPLSATSLRRALSAFRIVDWTPQILTHPDSYAMGASVTAILPVTSRLPAWAWRLVGDWVPNFNWILVKADQ